MHDLPKVESSLTFGMYANVFHFFSQGLETDMGQDIHHFRKLTRHLTDFLGSGLFHTL